MTEDIRYTELARNGLPYAEIRLHRPAKGNAMTAEMLAGLEECVQRIAGNPGLRAVVLRGEGRFFSTGGDIAAWGGLTPEQMHNQWILRGIQVFEAIASLPQPVVAALHGHALGGGLELALCADVRIAETSARFGTPEVKIGMIAGWGGVRRLAETIGPGRARHMALLGDPITAQQALDWGLVTAVADGAAAFEALLAATLDRLLANAPIAMGLTKRILANAHTDLRWMHAEAAASALQTADCKEGVRAFAEKRPAVFQGR
jgi:enoyl-CoA hydratase